MLSIETNNLESIVFLFERIFQRRFCLRCRRCCCCCCRRRFCWWWWWWCCRRRFCCCWWHRLLMCTHYIENTNSKKVTKRRWTIKQRRTYDRWRSCVHHLTTNLIRQLQHPHALSSQLVNQNTISNILSEYRFTVFVDSIVVAVWNSQIHMYKKQNERSWLQCVSSIDASNDCNILNMSSNVKQSR